MVQIRPGGQRLESNHFSKSVGSLEYHRNEEEEQKQSSTTDPEPGALKTDPQSMDLFALVEHGPLYEAVGDARFVELLLDRAALLQDSGFRVQGFGFEVWGVGCGL